jgi:hypothetical protein
MKSFRCKFNSLLIVDRDEDWIIRYKGMNTFQSPYLPLIQTPALWISLPTTYSDIIHFVYNTNKRVVMLHRSPILR